MNFALMPSFALIKGGIDYKIPIDYSKMNQEQLELKADGYYNSALAAKVLNDDMTSALYLYTMLKNIAPDNMSYALRLGKLYDVLRKDKYAKGEYYRALGLNQSRPEPYFYLGSFYYDREQYKRALKFYQKAYDRGYQKNYRLLYNMGDIYQKFGDTKKALQFLEDASNIEPSIDLDLKIQQVKNSDSNNKEYYRR